MDQITNFWNYFQQNNFIFLFLNEIEKQQIREHFDRLKAVLQQYNKDLEIIIIIKENSGELIISASGNPYLFKEVELLMQYAPVIKRWKTTAFLQPKTNLSMFKNGSDRPMEFYGISLKTSEIYFTPLKNRYKPTEIGIKVLLKNYIIYKENPRLREAVYLHIEHLIGEKAFSNDIAFIAIGQWERNDDYQIELYHLKSYLDSRKAINFRK